MRRPRRAAPTSAPARDDHAIHDRPGHLIRRLQQIAVAIFMAETRRFNITPVQYSALLAIDIHPGIDQITLASIIAFDRSTIGNVVGRLENKRWIKRAAGAQDRRTKRLTITAQGRKVLREIDASVEAAQKLILAPLRAAERPAFMGMLRQLVHINNDLSRAPVREPRERDGVKERSRPRR